MSNQDAGRARDPALVRAPRSMSSTELAFFADVICKPVESMAVLGCQPESDGFEDGVVRARTRVNEDYLAAHKERFDQRDQAHQLLFRRAFLKVMRHELGKRAVDDAKRRVSKPRQVEI